MKISISFLVIIHLFITQLFTQNFRGKLVYKVVIEDSVNLKEQLKFTPLSEVAYSKICTVLIKNDSLKSTVITESGITEYSEYQISTDTYLMSNGQRISYNAKGFGKDIVSESKIKNKNQRTILGYVCKELKYTSKAVEMEKIWISDSLNFKEQYNNGKFFLNYFCPKGLVFRKETYSKGVLHSSWELIEVQKYDVPSEQFDNYEMPKKNGNFP
jgi:hypothetical protein